MSTFCYQIEAECTNPRSGDLFVFGRYETLEEANANMQKAIDQNQGELDLKVHSSKKEITVYLTRETLDDDGDWLDGEIIAAAKVVFRKRTLWHAEKMDYEVVESDD